MSDSTMFASGQLVKAALLASRDLDRTSRDVLVTIAAHGNGMGDSWPSVETIAEYVGKSARTIQRVLAKLVALGRLVARARKGASTVYRLAADAVARVVRPRQIATEGVTEHATTPDSVSVPVSPEVGFEAEKSKEGRTRPRFTFTRNPKGQTPAPKYPVRQGAANPPAAGADRCGKPGHERQLAGHCPICRWES